jgi:coenzyme F420-0:L-glutamate ligase/coenzyme F420-1:gamma-L-glutamate ligase
MQATVIAVADQLASAADLAGGKVAQLPVVVVRGYRYEHGEGGASALIMDRAADLFP